MFRSVGELAWIVLRGDLKSHVLGVSIACGALRKGSAVVSFVVSLARRGKRAGKSRGVAAGILCSFLGWWWIGVILSGA